MPYVITEACIQCGACVTGCESSAITEGENQSHIDVAICVECGTCVRSCPSEAIIWVDDAPAASAPAAPPAKPEGDPPRAP